MNKKGFTLVEILSVIVVLGVMAILVFPNAGQSNDIKKEKELENLIKTIENSAKMYHSFNEDTYKVSIETLVDEEYLVGNITNPVTEELMQGCVRTTLNEEGTYEYNYGSCDVINVSFNAVLNGGSTTQTFQSTYQDSTILELAKPTRVGYTFDKWELIKGNSVIKGNTLVIGTTETEIHAMWKSMHTITINYDGGTPSLELDDFYETGHTILLSNPTKAGYIFTGWTHTSGDGTLSGDIFTVGNEDAIITANWKQAASIPIFTYSGTYEIVDDSNNVIANTSTHSGNWKIRFLTDGDLKITDLKGAANGIDIFVVGGGGNGSNGGSYVGNGSTGGGGGGGGASITVTKFPVEVNVTYKIDIGAKTQNTSFSKGSTAYYTALAGSTPESPYWGGAMVGRIQPQGEGGAGRLSGQTDLYGAASVKANAGGKGNGSKGTYEFNGTSGLRYGAGGGTGGAGASVNIGGAGDAGSSGGTTGGGKGGQGCSYTNDGSGYKTSGGNAGTKGSNNTGSGGGGGGGQCGSSSTSYGSKGAGGAGGTGIVIIRNTR